MHSIRPFWRKAPAVMLFAALMTACGSDPDPGLTVATPQTEDVETGGEATPTSPPTTPAAPDADGEATGEDPAGDDGEDSAEADDEPDPPAPDGGDAIPTPTQAPISGEPAFTSDSKLTTVGLDEVFFGDLVDFAADVADTTWIGLPDEGSRPQCYTVQPSGGPTGIYFTVIDGFIERVDVTNPLITTRSGAGVGSSEASLVDLFGSNLETTELGEGNEIAFVPTDVEDRQFRIIWTTDGSAVVHMRAGRIPGILATAPCG